MLSSDFNLIFENFPKVRNLFDGTCSADTIPKRLKLRRFLICNTDRKDGPGVHWFAIIKTSKNVIEVFDSLGIDEVKCNFLKNNLHFNDVEEVFYNVTPVQSLTSTTCGQFVVYFIIERLSNQDLNFTELLNEIFELKTEVNESKVKSFFKNIIENKEDAESCN